MNRRSKERSEDPALRWCTSTARVLVPETSQPGAAAERGLTVSGLPSSTAEA